MFYDWWILGQKFVQLAVYFKANRSGGVLLLIGSDPNWNHIVTVNLSGNTHVCENKPIRFKRLKLEKFLRPDRIQAYLYKGLWESLVPLLCHIISLCITTWRFIHNWTLLKISPVPKNESTAEIHSKSAGLTVFADLVGKNSLQISRIDRLC